MSGLKKLIRENDYELTNEKLSKLLESDLDVIELKFCPKINDTSMIAISDKCPALTEINLSCFSSPITDLGIKTLVSGCPSLKRMNLYSLKRITDESIYEIASKSKFLQNINLCCYETQINEESIIALAQSCHYIDSIHLGFSNITDIGVIEIAKNCPNLKFIDLFGNSKITDDSIIEISKNCPLLQRLGLDECRYITDKSIIEISKKCPFLKEINLSHNQYICDETLIELSRTCILLKTMVINHCPKISAEVRTYLKSKYFIYDDSPLE